MDPLSTELVDGLPPVLRVRGEIDLATADALGAALRSALSACDRLVVDFADVSFIDVSGLRVLLQTAEGLNGHGPLTLVHAPGVVRLLDLLGLRDVAPVRIPDEA